MQPLFAYDDDYDGLPASPRADSLVEYTELLVDYGVGSPEAQAKRRQHQDVPEFEPLAMECDQLVLHLKWETPTRPDLDFTLDADAASAQALEAYAALIATHGPDSKEAQACYRQNKHLPEFEALATECARLEMQAQPKPVVPVTPAVKARPEAADNLTAMLSLLNGGNGATVAVFYYRTWPFLVVLANKSLLHASVSSQETSMYLSALGSFAGYQDAGKLPQLHNRGELIHLLAAAVARAVYQKAQAGSKVGVAGGGAAALVKTQGPTPLEQKLARDFYSEFTNILDPALRPFANMHLAGTAIQEIARQLECSESTVERKIKRIHQAWQQKVAA